MNYDVMYVKGFRFQVHIGCFEPERSVRQMLSLEFEAHVPPIPQKHRDDPNFIVLDYAVVSKHLKEYLEGGEFRLLETAAEGVADLLMERFPIQQVTIHLTKTPVDMPEGSSVTYSCKRAKE